MLEPSGHRVMNATFAGSPGVQARGSQARSGQSIDMLVHAPIRELQGATERRD